MHPTAIVILTQSQFVDLYDDAERNRRARDARLTSGLERPSRSFDRIYDAVARLRRSRRSSRIAASACATIWTPSSISASDRVP